MDISMIGNLQILKNQNGNYVPLSSDDVQHMSIGGFSFEIGDDLIPFDWDAFSINEEDNMFHFETGRGLFFNDYEISDCYDEEYEDIGIKREEITAEFLASTHHIEEFFIYFDDNEEETHGLGGNTDSEQYKINILDMLFLDMGTKREHPVSKEVIKQFNKGE